MQVLELNKLNAANWEDLSEIQPELTRTPVESIGYDSPSVLSASGRYFMENGVCALEKFLPDDLIDAYVAEREQLPKDRGARDNFWNGWAHPTPYMHCQSLQNLATEPRLQHVLNSLIGYPMGLHLALTGWVSTERKWHQDSYLNPDWLWSHYIAVWIALDDIDADSGPFEFVPGSHRWEVLRRHKLWARLTNEQRASPHWPTFTQDKVAQICEQQIVRRKATVEQYLPKKGDVLMWHSNLMHRGSKPKNPDLLRKSLICHYSSIVHRVDMMKMARNPNTGVLFFDLPTSGDVRPLE